MSLIQVSSSQLNSQNSSQFKEDYNKGYSFSNYFNNLLDIPPNSELALHSAQFRVKNTSQYDLIRFEKNVVYRLQLKRGLLYNKYSRLYDF